MNCPPHEEPDGCVWPGEEVGDDNAEGQNKSLPVATSELRLEINSSQKAQTLDSFVLPMIEETALADGRVLLTGRLAAVQASDSLTHYHRRSASPLATPSVHRGCAVDFLSSSATLPFPVRHACCYASIRQESRNTAGAPLCASAAVCSQALCNVY